MKKLYQTTFDQVLDQLGPDPARVAEQRAALASRCSAEEKEAPPMRIKKTACTLLAAAAVVAAVSVGALAASGGIYIPLFTGGNITQYQDENGVDHSSITMDTSTTPLELRDGRLYLAAEGGQELDLTGQFSEQEAYIYTYTDAENFRHDIVIGGTIDNYGCQEFIYYADGAFSGGGGSYPSGYSPTNPPEWLTAYGRANGLPMFGQDSDAADTGSADSSTSSAENPSGSAGSSFGIQPLWLEMEITVENGRVLLTVDGETLDITGQFSKEQAYVYTAPGIDENGFQHILLVGGTPEDPRHAEYAWEEGGSWHMPSNADLEDSPWLDAWMAERGLNIPGR